MNNNKSKSNTRVFIFLAFLIIGVIFIYSSYGSQNNNGTNITNKINKNQTFTILASQENKNLEEIVKDYAKSRNYNIQMEYAGTLDIMNILNNNSSMYDAVWLSNSIWGYMLDTKVSISNSKCTSINPVIFGIKKSKAEELGFVNKQIYTKDILDAISNQKLKFSMSNPTTTNSGASAYLGLLFTLAGNPEVLTKDMLENENLRTEMTTLFSGLERSSGSEDFLEELFLNGDYEAAVTYESSIININKKLISQGKEPLYAIYPIDGVSISDSPFAYINNKNDEKKKIFEDIQKYILSSNGQKLLQEKGKRTWYGGITTSADKTIFNPEWGIDTTKYISPIKYPSIDVIKFALNLYQVELRKPVHVAFCLDYSGSMVGDGINELKKAMKYILTEEASSDYIQFSYKDKIDIIPFASNVQNTLSTNSGTNTMELLNNINSINPSGRTALYPAAVKALDTVKDENQNLYNTSIIIMTDGQANVGSFYELKTYYQRISKQIPIYSIMFGSAVEQELEEIAELTNAKVFDGKKDLVEAFKQVRGYN